MARLTSRPDEPLAIDCGNKAPSQQTHQDDMSVKHLIPHFYTVKLGYEFLIFAPTHR